ncbi:MAG: epimerase, partial [Armatimonadota bacterium]
MSRILFIGGTRFVGRGMVEAALERGHQVTLFHRGQSGADLFPSSEHILGDRNMDLEKLQGMTWDLVIDVAGFAPSVVRKSVEALQGTVNRYAFVSSISVHTEEGEGAIDEQSPLQQMPEGWDGIDEAVTPETYGALKVLCEQEVSKVFGENALLFRTGLVVGPNDVSDRFTSWVRAGAQDKEIDIPTTPDQPVQFTDA